MKRIMFVCLGNICRSPLAEAVFAHKVMDRGLEKHFEADSSGTTGYHAGERSDPRMRQVARDHGVVIDHRAQKLNRQHITDFDMILCMDQENLHGARSLARSEAERAKIQLLRDFDPEGGGSVPDPYYGGVEGFEKVFQIVDRSTAALLDKLEGEL